MELDFSDIVPAIPGLWNGMLMTLQLMVLGVVGGIILGTLLALMRLSHNKLLSTSCCRASPVPTSTTSVRSRCCW